MKIKELKAHGFKSFADGIRLQMHEGVTSVVGPNGCGKSNIVDAMRWVMGELSARHLRGHSMEDVIFGGSEYRKPMGRAEVSVILTDVTGLSEPYRNFTEIEVTRRLYRTGESEYLINQVPCRRRDIAELFLESGVGTRTISIIEQGQVGRVIDAGPMERRFFIEQAAGILKYKSRREEAVRKLDATKQNLLRVEDVLRELTRQRTQLENQAERARRYKAVVAELKTAELADASARYLDMDTRRAALAAEVDRLSAEKEAQNARLSSLDARIAQARLERAERERNLTAAQENLLEVSKKLSAIEMAKQVAAEGVRLHGSAAQLADEEAARLEGRESQLSEEHEAAEREGKEAETRLEELARRLSEEQAQVEVQAARHKEAEAAREEARTRALQLASRLEACSSRLAFAEKMREETSRRIARLEGELSEVQSQLARLAQTSFGFEEVLRSSRENRGRVEADARSTEEKLQAQRSAIEVTRAELRSAKENLAQSATRLSSLREIERRYEGYGAGVQAIMLEAERRLAQEGRNGIYGLVADVIRTRPEYERAVESLLGERLQYVVVKSHNESVEAVEFLKRESRGRGSFVPLTLRADPAAAPAADRSEGVVGALREVVDVKEGYDAVADYLLGDVLLVDRLDRAVNLWEHGPQVAGTLVTLDGDVVDRHGVITGGTAGGTGAGILQKKREIAELAEAVERAGEAVRQLEAREASEAAQLSATEADIERFRLALHRTDIDITSQEKDVERVGEEKTQILRRQDVIEADLTRERAEGARFESDVSQASGEQKILEEERRTADTALVQAETLARSEEDSLRAASARLGEVKVEAASLRERAESLAAQVQRLAASLAEVRSQKSEKKDLAARERGEVGRLAAEVAAQETALSEGLAEREAAERGVGEAREVFDSGERGLLSLEEELSRERAGMDELGQRLSEITVSLREIELHLGQNVQDIRERYEMELPAHVESLDPVERERLQSEQIRAELHEEAERQRRRLKAVGSVNVDAIQEFDDLIEREKFLKTQHEDLVKSVSDLEKAIAKINKTTRERFRETFQAIDKGFREVFPKLFQGGRARLELTDEMNLLETGVEIIAQPPGKKLPGMNMLSGGEKALTAIALLLAIYLIKPAPFVILDEVDAPLDDVNVGRFGEVVRRMIDHSQVIVITHNKQTMQLADTLVGVTMEEPGVSKLVSVQLD